MRIINLGNVTIEVSRYSGKVLITVSVLNSVSLSARLFRELSSYGVRIRSVYDEFLDYTAQRTIISREFDESDMSLMESYWRSISSALRRKLPSLWEVLKRTDSPTLGDPVLVEPEEYQDPVKRICNEVLRGELEG